MRQFSILFIFVPVLILSSVYFVRAFQGPAPGQNPGTGGGLFTIDGARNVGLGTSNPSGKFDVEGTINARRIVIDSNNQPTETDIKLGANANIATDNSMFFWIDDDNNGNDNFYFRRGVGYGVGTTLMTIKNSGNVGIGINNPTDKLHISGAVRATTFYGDGSNLTGIVSGQWTDAGGYVYANNATDVVVKNNSRVGIGMTNPGFELDVASGGANTARFGTVSGDKVVIGGGAGKLDVGTVDPVYTIGEKRYATYMAGMIGVKEEVTNIVVLENCKDKICSYKIDFENLKEGSDLWLFSKTTDIQKNFEEMSVLITPSFDGRVWYRKYPSENILILFGDNEEEISYRFSAPRFDSDKWTNYSDGEYEGFDLNTY